MPTIDRRLILKLAGAIFAEAALTRTAMAQPMGRGNMGGPGAAGGPGFGRGLNEPASYLAALKTRLAITPDQEKAWDDYAETVTGVAGQMQGAHATVFESMPTATWQERQTMMNSMFAARDEAHKAVQQAAETLLPTLTPAQRSMAASTLPGMMPTPSPGGRRGMGQGQGRAGMPPPATP